jgi:broad specificity phosphatase PhoE
MKFMGERFMTVLILVRHGETEANVQQVWQGSMDAPLTERGHQQVAATATYIAELTKQYPVDAFYVSPLPRAQSTAAAIAQTIDQQPLIFDDLREFDLGDWEGRSFRELREKEDLWTRWRTDPWFAPPNGESPRSFNQRTLQAFQHLVAVHPAQTILAVTHGGLICNGLATWFGAGPDDWRRWEPHNCAISVLDYSAACWQALVINDISHLPIEAIVPNDQSAYAQEVS